MEKLLELLKDGHARTLEILAAELDTDLDDVKRQIEYLENMGLIKKETFGDRGCGNCSSCSGACSESRTCKGCLPDGGFKNMGQMWSVTVN